MPAHKSLGLKLAIQYPETTTFLDINTDPTIIIEQDYISEIDPSWYGGKIPYYRSAITKISIRYELLRLSNKDNLGDILAYHALNRKETYKIYNDYITIDFKAITEHTKASIEREYKHTIAKFDVILHILDKQTELLQLIQT